jgi:nucleoside-diphosphate-sugar epimerase
MDLDDGRIIPSFLRSVLEGEPLTVFGDGSQTRSYCYVDDLVRGIVSYATAQGLAGETMNLGNPEEFTVLSTAHTVRNLFPKQNLSIVHKPLPLDDPTRRRPDISKAMAKLQWQPHTALKEGLLKTFAWAQTTRDT